MGYMQGQNTVKYNDVINRINNRAGPEYQYDRWVAGHAGMLHFPHVLPGTSCLFAALCSPATGAGPSELHNIAVTCIQRAYQ